MLFKALSGGREPRQRQFDYGLIPPGFYEQVFRRQRGVQSKWHHLKFQRIRHELAGSGRLLDIGCGPGTFIGTLEEPSECVGVDIAASQISYARDHYGFPHRRFVVIDEGPLPFDDHTFDAVTCIELIEHLPAPAGIRICKEARRVLRSNGTFLVTTPDYGGLWPVLEWCLNRLGEVSYEDQHITHFTRDRLDALLRSAGFDEVQVSRFQFLAPFAAAFGWRFADQVARLEPRALTSAFGFLLLGNATPVDY